MALKVKQRSQDTSALKSGIQQMVICLLCIYSLTHLTRVQRNTLLSICICGYFKSYFKISCLLRFQERIKYRFSQSAASGKTKARDLILMQYIMKTELRLDIQTGKFILAPELSTGQ